MSGPMLVVRHGEAGDRERWVGPDDRRPLTAKGRRQADGLVEVLAPFPIERILSSWYVRCLETMVHVACDRQLPVELDPALAEGSSPADILALARSLAGTVAVLCTHGDVITNLLPYLERTAGLDLGPRDPDGGPRMAKGSTWVLEAREGRFVAARYLPAP